MKSIKIAGLCLVAMFVMSMVASATASAAAPEWIHCIKVEAGKGKWKNKGCTEATASGEWETKGIAETVEVTSSGSLELEDLNATGGPVAVKCAGIGVGSIGPGKLDRTNSISASKGGKTITCAFVKNGACESGDPVTAEAKNLPWQTRLAPKGTEPPRDEIYEGTGGEPGWTVTCTAVLVGKTEDTCTGTKGTTKMKNNPLTGNVESEFKFEGAERAKCTIGGAESGRVSETITTRQRNETATLVN